MAGLNMGDALCALSAGTSLAAADLLVLQLPFPFRVYGWGVYLDTTALDATPNPLLAALDRNVIATATRTDAVGGKTLSRIVDTALGNVLTVVPTLKLDFAVGEQAIIQVTGAPSAGAGHGFIIYRPQSMDLNNALRIDASL